jgi:redox-sensitive bicupin YhaK (pirin superfamily)
LWINQDAWFSLGKFSKGKTAEYVLNKNTSGVYAFVIEGEVTINLPTGQAGDQKLNKRDGLGVWEVDKLSVTADSDSEILLIEVPMN